MKNLILTVSLLAGSVLTAGPFKFSCSNVGGTEEWTIYVDLVKKVAGFFDNDSTVTIPQTGVKFLESLPPQMLYTFEGKDTGGAETDKLRISFNKTKMSASVTFNLGKSNQKTLQSLDGCKVDNNLDL